MGEAYARNQPLMAALDQIMKRKEGLTGTPENIFANYRADLSRGSTWKIAGARFVVATVTRRNRGTRGSVSRHPMALGLS